MLMNTQELKTIKKQFIANETITKNDLIAFIIASFPNKKPDYARFYLSDIFKNGIAYPVRTNLWKSSKGKSFFSAEAEADQNLFGILEEVSPSCLIALWNTFSLNRLLSLQIFNGVSIVSSYGFCEEEVFSKLSENSYVPLPLKTYKNSKDRLLSPKIVLMTRMNEDAPLFRGQSKCFRNLNKSLVAYPRLEKILIDCFCQDVALDSSQTEEIFTNAIKNYYVNFSVLERYAKSRGKKEEIISFLQRANLWDEGR
jgi:hypothetical protein